MMMKIKTLLQTLKRRRRKDIESSKKSSTSTKLSKDKTPPKTCKTNKSTTSTPTIPPTTTEAQATPVAESDPSPIVLQILSVLEKKAAELSKVDLTEVIEESTQANVINEVTNQMPKFIPKAVSEFIKPRMERTIHDALLTFDNLMGSTIDFTKFAMNHLDKDKITKDDLVGPVYKLLKGTCRSCIELEYNMEQCYLALSDQLDWKNPKGDRCPYDLSKPLPLQGPPGYLTIPVDFFFNNDLEYLRT
nr:hypothetical protein [Tanacetum cinerariifolium]